MNEEALIQKKLINFREELSTELDKILVYWGNKTPDTVNGGFFGQLDARDQPQAEAPKGSVLNARILWAFSAAFNLTGDGIYLQQAERACKYILDHFVDKAAGGVYWTVDYKGNKLDTKKQVYASAFTIYALAEYYRATRIKQVLDSAIALYTVLEEKAYDRVYSGYFEAFTEDWSPIGDTRLSQKDVNVEKSMNTHLHVLEGYTNLYSIWPDAGLKGQILGLLDNFSRHIIGSESATQTLFFDAAWTVRSETISFGHDIEASWLLLEAARIISSEPLVRKFETVSLQLAEKVLGGLDQDGGLWYELEPATATLTKEKHWWVQAEAMVGFFNAWEISGRPVFLETSLRSWAYVQEKIIDKAGGEWHWGIQHDGTVMPGQDKAGIWKCPYHNSRACIELIRRISLNAYLRKA